MFKLMGIFLAVIGSGAVGFYKAEEFKQRRSLLMDFRQMILHIASEISYFKEPLPQIFEKLSGGDERKSHVFLRQCNLSYRQTGVNLSDIWQASVDYVYAKQPLTEDDKKLMKRCADFGTERL